MSLSVPPLISVADLAQALLDKTPDLKLVDASFALPGTGSPYESFLEARIGQAVFFDIDAVSDHDTDLPHMLPKPEFFAKAVGDLGISNKDTVVLYGQTGTTMGPARAWWTFRVFGHDRVRVLDGGLPRWRSLGHPVNTHPPVAPTPVPFVSAFRPDLVIDRHGVSALGTTEKARILDARPADRFEGRAPEPRPGLRSGHIPGSVSLPCMNLLDPQTGEMKPPEELAKLFESCGVTSGKPIVASCGSGVTACVIALALAVVGREDVRVYDGSWAEWGKLPT